MAGRVAGKVAVVTGSGGLMGGAIALRLAEEGADIMLNGRRPDNAGRMVEPIRALGRDVASVVADVRTEEGAHAVIDAALARWGRIDILVNNVGGIDDAVRDPVWETDLKVLRDTWNFNMESMFNCVHRVLPHMMERRSGKIVNIGSTSWAGDQLHAHYAAAKAGVFSFSRAIAKQLGAYNINVNVVAPGRTVSSGLLRGDRPAGDIDLTSISSGSWGPHPLGRLNEPEDIANAVLFLASEEARNISGQMITVAAGLNPSL